MIFLILPSNSNTGWGICATNLAKELSQKHKIKYVSTEIENITDVIERSFFESKKYEDYDYLKSQTDYPIIQAVQHDLTPYIDYFSGSKKICLTFADRKIPKEYVEKSKHYDFIISGSDWSKKLLETNGVKSHVIHQGIDQLLFNKSRSKKKVFLNDFVIFSGGKFEDRKGQDIVIKAYKVFHKKHPDAKLVCSWYNFYTGENGEKFLRESGIDMNSVIIVPPLLNCCLPQIYQNTDVGIFPSRCEAGTNLVLMEYMACGKPVIASVETGQGDIVNEKTGLIIKSKGKCALYDKNISEEIVSYWEEPDVDSVIDNLEFCYNNSNKIRSIGINGANLMAKYTWKSMSDKLLNLI